MPRKATPTTPESQPALTLLYALDCSSLFSQKRDRLQLAETPKSFNPLQWYTIRIFDEVSTITRIHVQSYALANLLARYLSGIFEAYSVHVTQGKN